MLLTRAQAFMKKFRSDAKTTTFKTQTLDGGVNDQNTPGIEANLDIEYTGAW